MGNTNQKLMYVNKSAQAVLDERQRQIDAEDQAPDKSATDDSQYDFSTCGLIPPEGWTLAPQIDREDLVRAGASILAEIERLDRQ